MMVLAVVVAVVFAPHTLVYIGGFCPNIPSYRLFYELP